MMDDTELLLRYARDRSEEAFAELVNRRLALVYRTALRQLEGDEHRAKDAAQQVFILLARKAGVLARHASLTGWLYTTTHHTVSQMRRADRRRQFYEKEASPMITAQSDDCSAPPPWERLSPLLDEALRQLDARDRDAVLLRFFAQRSFADIGRALRLSEDAARMRVERALDKLRLALSQRGLASTSGALSLLLAQEAAVAAPAGLAAGVTGAALSAGTNAGLLVIMSTSKTIVGVSGVIALLAVGSAVYEMNQARQAEADKVQAVQERETMRKRLKEAESRPSRPDPVRQVAETPPPVVPAVSAPPALAAVLPAPPNPEAELVQIEQFRNVGRATPSEGFQTAIWAAMTPGQEGALTDSFVLDGPAQAKADELWPLLSEEVRKKAGRPENLVALDFTRELLAGQVDRMQVLGSAPEATDAALATLTVQFQTIPERTNPASSPRKKNFGLRFDGQDWKLVVRETALTRALKLNPTPVSGTPPSTPPVQR